MSIKNYEEWNSMREVEIEKYLKEKEKEEGKGRRVVSDRYIYPILITPKKNDGVPLNEEIFSIVFCLLDCTFEKSLWYTSEDDLEKVVYFEGGTFEDGTIVLRVDADKEYDYFFESLSVVLNEMLKDYNVVISADRVQEVLELKKSKDIVRNYSIELAQPKE